MIYGRAENIISPLGFGAGVNYERVKALSQDASLEGAARLHEGRFGVPEPFYAPLIDDDSLNEAFGTISGGNYTRFEKAAILAAEGAVRDSGIDPAAQDVIFVISTTKGNVVLLEDAMGFEPERVYLWRSAELISEFFGNPNRPVVVSNACISGCVAQIQAARLLESGAYRHAVVVGADMLCKFVVAGFQSFKSLSDRLCMPFDKDRTGLNLGEAAAAAVYSRAEGDVPEGSIVIAGSAICNDANHISGPSRTAEGLWRCLERLGVEAEKLAFVNAHGTSTAYNDDMESVALGRAGLSDVPVNSLKGYFGHTLGAAGLLETIISSRALREGVVLRSRGSENPGTVSPVNLALRQLRTEKKSFVKMLSGFGGCNAAILFELR